MSHHQSLYRFSVTADSDSTLLVRISGTLACVGLVPECLHAKRKAASADVHIASILLITATVRQIELLKRKLMQMSLVHSVECERIAAAECADDAAFPEEEQRGPLAGNSP